MFLFTTLLALVGSVALFIEGSSHPVVRWVTLLLALIAAVLLFTVGSDGGAIMMACLGTQILIGIGIVIFFGIDQMRW